MNTMFLYHRLLELSAMIALPHSPSSTLSSDETRQLLTLASRLSLGGGAERRQATEICVRLLELDIGSNPDCQVAIHFLLTRLGNFPAIGLSEARHGEAPRQEQFGLSIEAARRRIQNTVAVYGRHAKLTDFQRRVFRAMIKHKAVSLSAPTSAGKSTVLGLSLLDSVAQKKRIVVYLVPTRALIRQVVARTNRIFEDSGVNVPVRSIPVPFKPEEAVNGGIYVLTQERLISFLYSEEGDQRIDSLIVDEAQSIEDDARGIVLHSAIDAAISKFPGIRIAFAGPQFSNPGYFFIMAKTSDRDSLPVAEDISPVGQNHILVRRVKGKPNQAEFTLLHRDLTKTLGVVEVPFRSNAPLVEKRTGLAQLIGSDERPTLLYANGRAEAEAMAESLTARLSMPAADPEIEAALDFVKEYVHPEYPVADYIRAGVGLHYGPMPTIVRSLVEDLYAKKKLRFMVTTSTLLQGVDLPAKNIIIHRPRKGRGNPLGPSDFRNLAGRAGRLGKDFVGNVWVLHPEEWETDSYVTSEPGPVVSALESVLADGGTVAQEAMNELIADPDDLAIAALGKLMGDYGSNPGALVSSRYATPENIDELRVTARKLEELRAKIDLPDDLLRRHATLHPGRIQEMWDYLKDPSTDLNLLTPLHPSATDFYAHWLEIVRITELYLGHDESRRFEFYAALGSTWMNGTPLRKIIEKQLELKRNRAQNRSKPTRVLISEALQDIEDIARFRLVKHTRLFGDLYNRAFRVRNGEEPEHRPARLHLFLECGASKPVQLKLISLGLSRTTSILLSTKLNLPDLDNPNDYRALLARLGVDRLNIPAVCRAELRMLVSPSR